jgi:ribonuclease HIII
VAVPITTYTCRLTPAQAEALERWMRARDFTWREVPYARFAGEHGRLNLVFYQSGKLVVQGRDTGEFVEFTLEPLILKQARLGYEAVLQPELLLPRFGVDESGKGDFFGPLCVAGVYLNEGMVKPWQEAGVRDSKRITGDRRIAELADLIRTTPGAVFSVVPIGNEAYNRLYRALQSENRLLAWGHARVIENLMLQRHRMDPLPVRAISDQFAADKATVAKALMSLGREIELVQRHKAEADLAVAAASILARDEFLRRLRRLGEQFGLVLPKGSSKEVEAAGREFVARHGADELPKVAKMHFRTAARVQGLPEPARKEWKSRARKS